MMTMGALRILGAIVVSAACALPAAAATDPDCDPGTIISFDAPGADTNPADGNGTLVAGINDFGVVAGEIVDSNDVYHAFLRFPDGKFTVFDAPGAGSSPGSYSGTIPNGINDLGEVTGFYIDTTGTPHGFIRGAGGHVTSFDPPNSISTFPVAINLAGDVVGYYADSGSQFHAFLRKAGGKLLSFDGPGVCTGGTSVGCYGSAAFNINIFGTVAASFGDGTANQLHHVFIRGADGKVQLVNAPGAGDGYGQGTGCPGCWLGINTAGAIAGIYTDANGVYHTFLRTPEGSYLNIDAAAAGTASGQGTGCASDCDVSLNDHNEITGNYIDAGGNYHGFLRESSGKVLSVDPTGSTATFPAAINGRGAITGTYLDSSNVYHGFLRLPSRW